MALVEEIGVRMRQARLAAGLTQYELADRVGSREPSISKYETGRKLAQVNTLSAIAKALGVSLSWLVDGVEPEPPREAGDNAALRAFLASPLGRTTTESERATLASMKIFDAEPTEATYQAIVVGLRGTTQRSG